MTHDNAKSVRSEHAESVKRRNFLAELVVKMRPQLKSVAREHTHSLPDCKDDDSDIVSRSVLKAIKHVDQFEGKTNGQWRAWVISIVRNQARDVRRYWQQARRAHTQEESGSQVIRGLVDTDAPTPGKALDDCETSERLDDALASLPIDQQQLVRWRTYHYLTYREIAGRIKTTETTARRRCETAMAALRQAWEQLGSGSSA